MSAPTATPSSMPPPPPPGLTPPPGYVAYQNAPTPTGQLKRVGGLAKWAMATTALAAGVHPKVVQEQLGHATISVTLDTYSHLPQAVRSESAAIIARALRPQPASDGGS